MRVVATGIFDILHIGHLRFLQGAKKLGEELVVVVSCDSVCQNEKRISINSQQNRKLLVAALKPVDRVVIGYEGDKYKIITELKPDVLVLGYDQPHAPTEIEKELKSRKCETKVIKLSRYTSQSTSEMIRIIKRRG
jgi:FAD synthetase